MLGEFRLARFTQVIFQSSKTQLKAEGKLMGKTHTTYKEQQKLYLFCIYQGFLNITFSEKR